MYQMAGPVHHNLSIRRNYFFWPFYPDKQKTTALAVDECAILWSDVAPWASFRDHGLARGAPWFEWIQWLLGWQQNGEDLFYTGRSWVLGVWHIGFYKPEEELVKFFKEKVLESYRNGAHSAKSAKRKGRTFKADKAIARLESFSVTSTLMLKTDYGRRSSASCWPEARLITER